MSKEHSPKSALRTCAVIVALALAAALPLSGAAASDARTTALHPNTPMARIGWSPLSRAQIVALSGGTRQKVIVILRNQAHSLDGSARTELVRRDSAIAQAQRPVLAELRQVKATHIEPFHIINAISATVSRAEVTRLRANPAVRAVVPNATIPAPKLYSPYTKADLPAVRHNSDLPGCDFTSPPSLQPEALGLTNTAFANASTPQAETTADGAGVTVAIVSGPIDPVNQDFIRSNGTAVITDYENFSGDPAGTPSPAWNLESFLDMSSVGSQGREVFNANDYLEGAAGTDCNTFRILGMAPGANVMWLAAAGKYGLNTSAIVQSVQYAVDNGANVISQSFGGNPASDTGVDPTTLADQQAVADGVTVVSSSGDAGQGGSVGSPGSGTGIITAGATTQEQFRQLIGEIPGTITASNGKKLTFDKYQSNNIAAFSSSGVNQNGTKGVTLVAPGAFGFIDCTPNDVLYPGCDNAVGLPIPYQILGGTSESAPLTAGAAADVIEAYAKAHKGTLPSPAAVSGFLTSTATDLGDPAVEQGAGLINTLKAVDAASGEGSTLLTSPADLTASGAPGAKVALPFTVTNNGKTSESVVPSGRTLGAPNVQNLAVNVTASDVYSLVNFKVAPGTQHLALDESWRVVKQPQSWVLVTLIGPNGTYNDNTQNSQPGAPLASSGFGHVDVSDPTPGTWTAIVHNEGGSYTGAVHLAVSSFKYVSAGTVTPASATLAPGASASFALNTSFAKGGGDSNAEILVQTKTGNPLTTAAGTIPVYLRALVAISNGSGSFSGTIGGGNGRAGALYSSTYEFNAPAGLKDLEVNVKLPTSNDNIEGVLVGPDGVTRDMQSTVTALDENSKDAMFGLPTAYANTMQVFWRNPERGLWRFVLLINDNVSGPSVFQHFTGTVTFSGAGVSATGLPDSTKTTVASTGITVPVKIKNTGNTTKSYFVDARLNTNVEIEEGNQVQIPPPAGTEFIIPSETSQVIFAAESLNTKTELSQPVQVEAVGFDGAPPYGVGTDPDLLSTCCTFDVATGDYGSAVSTAAGEVTSGLWGVFPNTVGPYTSANGANPATIDLGALVTTQDFDTSAVASTGDPWATIFGASGAPYKPLVLAPGASGIIMVTITPSAPSGAVVSGHLYVDTLASTPGFPTASPSTEITWSGDEVASLPYTYTVK